MKNKYQNFFFLFGITIFAIMVYNLGFTVIVNNIRHAGHWFWLILALWLVLYLGNTLSWYLIIKTGKPKDKVEKINFFWLYKVTISAFSLNYATPGGLMGGEPYRIMELTPKIGTERATSSVLLFVILYFGFLPYFFSFYLNLFRCSKVVLLRLQESYYY